MAKTAVGSLGDALRSRKVEERPASTGSRRRAPGQTQMSAWVNEDVYNAVKVELIREKGKRSVSELVDELFLNWLKARGIDPFSG